MFDRDTTQTPLRENSSPRRTEYSVTLLGTLRRVAASPHVLGGFATVHSSIGEARTAQLKRPRCSLRYCLNLCIHRLTHQPFNSVLFALARQLVIFSCTVAVVAVSVLCFYSPPGWINLLKPASTAGNKQSSGPFFSPSFIGLNFKWQDLLEWKLRGKDKKFVYSYSTVV